jgi:hypothetical protein
MRPAPTSLACPHETHHRRDADVETRSLSLDMAAPRSPKPKLERQRNRVKRASPGNPCPAPPPSAVRLSAPAPALADIKLPNFLMDNRGQVQIMDFGLAQVEGVSPRAVAGTPWTMSPAGLKHGDDGRAGDWWVPVAWG